MVEALSLPPALSYRLYHCALVETAQASGSHLGFATFLLCDPG